MGCTHDCSSCGHDCGSEQDFSKKLNEMSSVKKVIGVVSGKGGVGKSLVTSLLAVSMQRLGFGTQVMSINLLLEQESDPGGWRGPVIAGAVGQFWTDVYWKDVDFMFVDMPPGTGDVPLTVFQSLPVDGIIVVTTPQQLVGMIVEKAVKMAEMMDIPLLGVLENMSTYTCPDCGKQHAVFGESHLEAIAAQHHIPVLARLPIQPALASQMDSGTIELFEGDFMQPAADRLCALLPQ